MRHWLQALFVLLAIGCVGASPASAQSFIDELKLGVLDHDTPGLWSGFRAETESVDINFEAILSPSVRFLGGTIRPAVGGTVNTDGGTSHAYVDARWQYELPGGFFFGAGLGAAVHDGQLTLVNPNEKALGSRVLFHIPLEIGYRFDQHNSLSAYFEHTSNAYLVDPNEGFDRVGVRYGYRLH